jgi:hypothetical protein
MQGQEFVAPAIAQGTDGQLQTQAMMKITEIVETGYDIDPCHQSLSWLG